MSAPKILGIVLKEHRIQLLAEAVDIEILEGLFFSLMEHCLKIAEAYHYCGAQTHVLDSRELERYWIIKELGVEENAAQTVAAEHHAIDLFGIGTALFDGGRPAQLAVVKRHSALGGEHLLPPCVDLGHLREKAVAAHIHAVALVIHGTRYTAENIALFEHGDIKILALIQ